MIEEQELRGRIDAFVEANAAAIVEDIAALVSVRSVEEAAAPGAPFGPGPRRALEMALEMARREGFAPHDGDGYVGWFELAGEREGHIATITHLDVVPEGDGWTADPFALRQKEDWLLGRGVIDDKGPSVLCLYMLKFFKEAGLPLRYGLRVLFGCSEETGMKDVGYYLARNPQPLFCFSPDADFPVCNGEKGHLNGVFTSPPLAGNLVAFSGGIADNVIPAKATCLVKADPAALKSTERVTVCAEDGRARLDATGIGGHAAHPQGSLNANGVLVDYLLENRLCTPEEEVFLSLLQRLHRHTDGSGLGIACRDDVFDALTLNGGILTLEDGRLRQSIDIRYPTATTAEALTARLAKQAGAAGADYETLHDDAPFYIPADAPTIQALLKAYNDISGENGKPFTMGGGTYARHFKNAVSYGPAKQDDTPPAFVGPMHGADEGASLPALLEALKVYILAVWRLQGLELEG